MVTSWTSRLTRPRVLGRSQGFPVAGLPVVGLDDENRVLIADFATAERGPEHRLDDSNRVLPGPCGVKENRDQQRNADDYLLRTRAQVVVRPDGYIGYRTDGPEITGAGLYLARWAGGTQICCAPRPKHGRTDGQESEGPIGRFIAGIWPSSGVP